MEENISLNQQNKNISLDFDIIWSKINDENRLVDFDMTDTSYYKEWASDDVKNEVILAYVSMHDSVKKMAVYLRDLLVEKKINVAFFNLTVADIGQLAMKLVDAATLVLGAPTVLAGIHPMGAYAVYLANALRPKTKFISLISSYGWGEKAGEVVKGMLTNFKAELLTPVISKGLPKENDFKELERLASDIARKHKEIGLLK